MRWMRRLRLRRVLRLRLRLWRLHRSLLAGLVLAAAAAAPMPMRLHLTVVRSRPLFRLGLRRFCCHNACASWYFAFRCIELRVLLLVEPFHDRARMLPEFSGRWRRSNNPPLKFLNRCRPFPSPRGLFLDRGTRDSTAERRNAARMVTETGPRLRFCGSTP